jgi:hypothetical protein
MELNSSAGAVNVTITSKVLPRVTTTLLGKSLLDKSLKSLVGLALCANATPPDNIGTTAAAINSSKTAIPIVLLTIFLLPEFNLSIMTSRMPFLF